MGGIQNETTAVCNRPELWDAKQTAKALGLSERALWDLSFPRGKLPVCRLGRSVRYRPADVAAYVAANTTGVTV